MLAGVKRSGSALYGHVKKHHKAYGAAAGAIQKAQRVVKAVSKTQTARRINPTITTTQQDTSVAFKRKPMSKSKVRKIKFAKKVNDATKVEQPFSLYHETQLTPAYIQRLSNLTIDDQWVAGDGSQFGINYGSLVNSSGYDLPYFASRLRIPLSSTNADINTGAARAISLKDAKIHITHNRMSLAITNIQGYAGIWEVYQFVAAENITQSGHKNPYSSWVTCLTNTPEYIAGSTNTPLRNGMTPLDAPGFGRYWRLIKKDRVLLAGGGTTELVMSGLHKRTVTNDDLTNNYAVKGLTQYFLVVGGIGDNQSFIIGNVFATQVSKTWHAKTDGDGINGPDRPIQAYQAI